MHSNPKVLRVGLLGIVHTLAHVLVSVVIVADADIAKILLKIGDGHKEYSVVEILNV